MSRTVTLLALLLCALLEAAGDALIRKGMHVGSMALRIALFLAGATVLFSYGWLVNRPPWTFGRLLGIYVVLFFVMAQITGVLFFGDKLNTATVVGGALIVLGGIVVSIGG